MNITENCIDPQGDAKLMNTLFDAARKVAEMERIAAMKTPSKKPTLLAEPKPRVRSVRKLHL